VLPVCSEVHAVDYVIVAVYFLAMVGVGVYFLRRQGDVAAYFVGSRRMTAGHIGLSVVATDVGGGFSIGLGGLGFSMGMSGSWLLFTGLIGAWLSAVLLIPRVKRLGDQHGWLTFPQYLEYRYDGRTRLLAAVVSGVAYAAFVGAQILAGAKLGAVAFGVTQTSAVIVMAAVVILYTTFGGLEAVVYTDTIQWVILLGGLLLVGVPFAWLEVGGWDNLTAALPPGHLSFTELPLNTAVTWLLSIVPIWFVGNTLYQRIYASRDVKAAQRAWYLAGVLEWPLLALLGTVLGVFARVIFPDLDPETEAELGLPKLIAEVLPAGVTGLMMAAYLSAVMSTADSCLLASVGHFVSDVYERHINPAADTKHLLRLSRVLCVVVGTVSIAVALLVPTVLEAILLAYAFMVCGLFAPLVAGLVWRRASAIAAFFSILAGGGLAVVLTFARKGGFLDGFWDVDPVVVALPASALVMVALSLLLPAGAPAKSLERTGAGDDRNE